MIKYIIVNGYPRSGKDTFVDFCKEAYPDEVVNISTVDFVKYIARECGWDGTKSPKNRKFLSDLKDVLTDWDDVPFKKVVRSAERFAEDMRSDNVIAFVHCREPKEIEKFVSKLSAETIFVNRDDAKQQATSNHADSNVENYAYDIYIDNNGTLDDLRKTAESFIKRKISRLSTHTIGRPIYGVGDKVRFRIEIDGAENEYNGSVFIVDKYGTFEQSEEPSYDIMVDDYNGEECLFKHIRESSIV